MRLKKILAVMGAAAVMMSGCGKQETEASSYFEVKDLKWGMSVDEALKTLGTDKDKAARFDDGYKYSAYFELEDGMELFGEKTEKVHVEFIDATVSEAEPKLFYIDIQYGEDADMAKVVENMEKAFGKKADKLTEYGMSRSALDSADGEREKSTVPRSDCEAVDTMHLWKAKTLNEVIPKDKSDAYEDLFETSFLWLSDKTWDEFKDNASLVTVMCTTGENDYGYRENWVSINAYNLLAYNTWTEAMEK